MIGRIIFHKFWYLLWFIILPAGVAWCVVAFLDRIDAIDELEIWYVLLLFAMLAFISYSLRERLPFWQDRNPQSALNQTQRRKEAQEVVRSVRKILKRRGAKISQKGKVELEETLTKLEKAITEKDDDAIVRCLKILEEKSDRHLAFARKSAGREYFESIGIAVAVAVVLRLFVIEAFKIPSESMVPTLMVGDHIFVSKYRYGLTIPLTSNRLVRFAKPAYGEVVVFIKPPQSLNGTDLLPISDPNEMTGQDFIKRIVGLPGDKVEIRDDTVYINNQELPRCRVGNRSYRTFRGNEWQDAIGELWVEKHGDYLYTVLEEPSLAPANHGPFVVPSNQVFVLGDNRDNSNDSRYWGYVPFDNIKGRAMFIWWSNRRPHGFQWDRFGQVIMNGPTLNLEQQKNLETRCPNLQ